jgi:hypothetical protein
VGVADEIDEAPAAATIDPAIVCFPIVVPDGVAEFLIDTIDGTAVAVKELGDLLSIKHFPKFGRRYIRLREHGLAPS